MKPDSDKLIDELIAAIKHDESVSDLKLDRKTSGYISLIQDLQSMPKNKVPAANFERVKNQLLDRIAIPKEEPVATHGFGLVLSTIPRFLRIGAAVMGSFLILISLTVGTAVASLQSVPGEPIYQFKQVVENIQLKLASTETERVNLQIKFANNRLEELEKVLEQNKQGKISGAQVQKIVEKTMSDVAKASLAASQSTHPKPEPSQVTVLTKLVDLGSKQTAILESASIQSEGDVKIELEKAVEASKISQEKAIENIEKAGLKVEANPILIETEKPQGDKVEAKGKLTATSTTSINIGSAKFFFTKDTKFVNVIKEDLTTGQVVTVKGQIISTTISAVEIILEQDVPKVEPPAETPEDSGSGQ